MVSFFSKKNNKIIVRLSGGLGNQMFQYSYALILSKKLNREILIDDFILRDYPLKKKFTKRNFELNIYKNQYNFFIKDFLNGIPKRGYFYSFFSKIKLMFYNCYLITDSNIPSFNELKRIDKNIYLSGIFQEKIDYSKYNKIIIDFFSSKNILYKKLNFSNSIKDLIINSNSVSIHIRRGDYLKKNNLQTHGLCTLDYYKKAINYFVDKNSNINFFIFSDDLEWCKNNFNLTQNIFYCEGSPLDDFVLMSLCKNNIIANSSFSWWSAFLNQNENKIVIYPQNWFTNKDLKIYTPDDWIMI